MPFDSNLGASSIVLLRSLSEVSCSVECQSVIFESQQASLLYSFKRLFRERDFFVVFLFFNLAAFSFKYCNQ